MQIRRLWASFFLAIGIGVWSTSLSMAAEGGPPSTEFQDTYWVYCEESCDAKVYWHRIHLRADGSSGYQRTRSEDMVYDGTDRWKLVGPYLVLMWTNAASVEVFQVNRGGQQTYRGLHSEVTDISVIQRARESGGTLPEP